MRSVRNLISINLQLKGQSHNNIYKKIKYKILMKIYYRMNIIKGFNQQRNKIYLVYKIKKSIKENGILFRQVLKETNQEKLFQDP